MIDWQNHDGVNIPMIRDFMRNQFYEDIIKDNVQDKTVLDIGFGTGLLSILALKHGAKHIIAYESNEDRYQLGIEMIESCGLQNKVELRNEKYNWTLQDSLDVDVVITETVNGDLWWEGMWNNLPRQAGPLFLPGEYFCEIYVKPIPKAFAELIGVERPTHDFFYPAVDLDETFVDFVNQKISDWRGTDIALGVKQHLHNGINKFNNRVDTVWGWIPWMRAVDHEKYLNAKTIVNANKSTLDDQKINFAIDSIDCDIHLDASEYSLVVPRMGLSYGEHKLYLDTGHWGPTNDAIICKGLDAVTMSQSTRTGAISYAPLC